MLINRKEGFAMKKRAKKGKEENIITSISNNWYMMKLAVRICPKRVLCSGLSEALGYFSWLFISGFFSRYLISLVEQEKSYGETSTFLIICVVLFFCIKLYDSWYEERLKPVADVEVYQGLCKELYNKACNVELSCFEDSEFYNRYLLALEEADQRIMKVIDNIWSIILGTAAVIISCFMMFQLDPYAILFAISPIIGNFIFSAALNRISYHIYKESVVFKRVSDYVNRVVHLKDYAKEIRLTKIFQIMQEKHKESVKGITGVIDKYALRSILYGWGYLYFTFTIIFEGVLFYGAYRTMVSNTMKLSEFSVLSSLMVAVSWILIGYSDSLVDSMKNSLYIANLKDFLEYQPAVPENLDGIIPENHIYQIEFRNVDFRYRTGDMVLKDINFRMQEGETCALAGYNGAGKSTLVKLLLRLYDPVEGEILVNGRNIKEYNLRAYRKLFATAFQDGKIFARSIRDNIWMGEKLCEESEQKIWQALELAGIKQTIDNLPRKLDTVLTREFTDDGIVFSGGQCQKILAARAFVNNCSVMVFDEPSSALDPIAEHELFNSIQKAKSGKTLFFISHRLSSVQNADQVLFLKNGRIVEYGNHRELMNKNGEYASLYWMQAKNYQAIVD